MALERNYRRKHEALLDRFTSIIINNCSNSKSIRHHTEQKENCIIKDKSPGEAKDTECMSDPQIGIRSRQRQLLVRHVWCCGRWGYIKK